MGISAPDQNGSFWEADVRSSFASFPFPAPIPDHLPKQLHSQGNWTETHWIKQHLEAEGFTNVKVTIGRRNHHVENAGDFIETFGPMLSWFVTQWWDEETRKAHPAAEVLELTKKHLTEKHHGQGWDMEWSLIYATAQWKGDVCNTHKHRMCLEDKAQPSPLGIHQDNWELGLPHT